MARPAAASAAACAGTALLIIGLYFVSRGTFLRLVRAAEASLLGLRVRTFEHIHRLSIADHVDQRRGALVSRVTSDVETMAQFTEWGAVAWIVDSVLIVTTIGVMLIYSWQLALVSVAVFLPLIPALRYLQRRQLAAYDEVRTAVGGTLTGRGNARYQLDVPGQICWDFHKTSTFGVLRVYAEDKTWFGLGTQVDSDDTTIEPNGHVGGCAQ